MPLSLVFPVLLLVSGLKSEAKHNALDRVFLKLTSPLEKFISSGLERSLAVWKNYILLKDVHEENQELRRVNAEVNALLLVEKGKTRTQSELRDLLELRKKIGTHAIAVNVKKSSLNSFMKVSRLSLDLANVSIEPGMAVLAADGLVGRIGKVGVDDAEVLLLTDKKSSIDVSIGDQKLRGVLSGTGKEESLQCKVEYIEQNKAIEIGDKVYTSGLGQVYPAGLLLGTVTGLDNQKGGLYQDVFVLPMAKLSTLSHVLVLREAPPAPDDDNAQAKNTSPKGILVPL